MGNDGDFVCCCHENYIFGQRSLLFFIEICNFIKLPVPVGSRSKAMVCGRSRAEIVGSNPTCVMDVCCECCVLLGRGLCHELITRSEKSYRLCCVVVCDLETS